MASAIRWTPLSASTLSMSSQMDSLADEGNAAGSLISASQNTYSDWFLHTEPSSAPSGHLELYLVTNFGGSSADGGASIDPPLSTLVGTFPLREATGAQNVPLNFILTPNRDFTPVVINKANVTLSGSNNSLYWQQYNENPDG